MALGHTLERPVDLGIRHRPTGSDLTRPPARQGPTGDRHVDKLGRPADHPCPATTATTIKINN
jgi:hypothetical protein